MEQTIFWEKYEIILNNLQIHSIAPNKKHNYIAYHWVRESVAVVVINMVHIHGKYNPSDILPINLEPIIINL